MAAEFDGLLTDAASCVSRELVTLTKHNPEPRLEPLCSSITVCTVEKAQPSALDSLEDPLPGMLFFLSPRQDQQEHPQLNEHPATEASEASQPQDAAESSSACEEKDASAEPLVPAASGGGSTLQVA